MQDWKHELQSKLVARAITGPGFSETQNTKPERNNPFFIFRGTSITAYCYAGGNGNPEVAESQAWCVSGACVC